MLGSVATKGSKNSCFIRIDQPREMFKGAVEGGFGGVGEGAGGQLTLLQMVPDAFAT